MKNILITGSSGMLGGALCKELSKFYNIYCTGNSKYKSFNYPYKKDYVNTQAIVTVNGPGVNRIVTLNYPNNVVFQDFHPSGTYNWQVTVDGISSENWLFQIDDKLFPIQDRSIDVTLDP